MRNLRPTLEYAWERTERLGNFEVLTRKNQDSTKIVWLELDDRTEIFPSSLTGSETDQRLSSREKVYGSIARLSGEFYLIPTGRIDTILVYDKQPFTQEIAKQIAEQHAKLYSNKKLKAEGKVLRDDFFYELFEDLKEKFNQCMICLTGKYESERYRDDLATMVMYEPAFGGPRSPWGYFIVNFYSTGPIKLKPIIHLPPDICIDFSNPERDGSSMDKAYELCSGEEM